VASGAKKPTGPTPVEAIVHGDKRSNIPTADAHEFVSPAIEDPKWWVGHRDPSLDPQLVWKGKDDESPLLEELAPPIYIQEKIDPRVLVENLRRTATTPEDEPELTLFETFDGLGGLDLVDFYEHDANWSNRMILGDSLAVMASLAEREQLRGKVQMVYIDPPYGIRFGSNWQVSARKRDVKDGKHEDTSREVEQIKAFRDTWELGIHSYLHYLRDRLLASRDLLTESGSCFVQIGDENVHLVRSLMDEVFGSENFVAQITFKKTSGASSNELAGVADFIIWYCTDHERMKYRGLLAEKQAGGAGGGQYTWLELSDGTRRRAERTEISDPPQGSRFFRTDQLTSQRPAQGSDLRSFDFDGRAFSPGKGTFKSDERGLKALRSAKRLAAVGNTLTYVRFLDDFPAFPINNMWDDTVRSGFADTNLYVVQTSTRVIERCMLMCTDPGDLVFDPTCGSGTTAFVAEQWGRRWITTDTSRVALALARQRLMGARFPYYVLADTPEGRAEEAKRTGSPLPPAETGGDIRHGFVYERVQHITLKSVANNPDIVEGMSREDIDAAIRRHADFELLYDKPAIDKKKVRVTGPFTVESLSPHRALAFAGAREPAAEQQAAVDPTGPNFEQSILDNLQAAGIQNGRRQERLELEVIEQHAGAYVQAIATQRTDDGDEPLRIGISVGPQYGTVGPSWIKNAAKEAMKTDGLDLLAVLGFAFDPQAIGTSEDHVSSSEGFANVAAERQLGRIPVLLVRMNADLVMGEDLKKTGAGNLFTVFGEPDIEIRHTDDGVVVDLLGVDVYDPTTGEVRSRDTDRIALWMIDTDYDEESFFVRHCYFTGGQDPFTKLKRDLKAEIDEDAWASLYATTSRPFPPPSTGKIAVKVINDYGDEVLQVFDVTPT
jgi:adenine-specific DNA-methyltransferase